MYASSARRLLSAKTQTEKLAVLRELKRKLKEKLPSYQEFEANFAEIGFSDTFTKQKKIVQYILRRFDSFHSNGISLDYDQMTIEHLAPQNAKIGNSVSPLYIRQLGNLILIDGKLNDLLANKDFLQKQANLLEIMPTPSLSVNGRAYVTQIEQRSGMCSGLCSFSTCLR